MSAGLTPQKAQQRTALLGYFTESLPPSAGAFSRDEPHITGQRLAVHEPPRITQEYFRSQRRNWPNSGVGHEQSRSGTLLCLLRNLLRQVFDFFFHLPVQALQCAPPVRSMGQQRQERDLRLPVVAPQARTS